MSEKISIPIVRRGLPRPPAVKSGHAGGDSVTQVTLFGFAGIPDIEISLPRLFSPRGRPGALRIQTVDLINIAIARVMTISTVLSAHL